MGQWWFQTRVLLRFFRAMSFLLVEVDLHCEVLVVDDRAREARNLVQLGLYMMQAVFLTLDEYYDLGPEMNDLWRVLVVFRVALALRLGKEAPRGVH